MMRDYIRFDEAERRFTHEFSPVSRSIDLPLQDALGATLRKPLFASLDQPLADHSAMDGYAIRHVDAVAHAILRIQQHSYAGDISLPLEAGCATRVFTGSFIPEGADTVVMQEDCHACNDILTLTTIGKPGTHIRHRGEDRRAGQLLFDTGTRIGPTQIAIAAAQGISTIPALDRVRVGILTSGDEIVAIGQARSPQQIYNSNAPMLSAMVQDMGAVVAEVVHATDDSDNIVRALQGLQDKVDVVITSGGASVGEKDFTRDALSRLGARLCVDGVYMKPGKPVALADLHGCPVAILPGNPGAALTTFMLLAGPLLRARQGRSTKRPRAQYLRIQFDCAADAHRDRFLWVSLQTGEEGDSVLKLIPGQGAGSLVAPDMATGFCRVQPGRPFSRGDVVPYFDFALSLA